MSWYTDRFTPKPEQGEQPPAEATPSEPEQETEPAEDQAAEVEAGSP